MMLKDDLKATVIQSLTLTEVPEKPETELEVGIATKDDFYYFESSDEHSKRDVQILQNADICVVVRDGDEVVHHNCIALKSFQPPRTPLEIDIEDSEAYVYNGWTTKPYRGKGVFKIAHTWRSHHLYELGIHSLYSEIDARNTPSLKATQKFGFQKVGERHTIDSGEFAVHMITGKSIYSNAIDITTLIGDIEIAKTHEDRFLRIEQELEKYIDQWSESGKEVVLFGSGNHAQKIVDQTELDKLVNYAVDEDQSKIGSNIPNTKIPVFSIEKLSNKNPDIIIICSEAFQNDMATRARAKSETTDIIVLYPHVSRFDEKD